MLSRALCNVAGSYQPSANSARFLFLELTIELSGIYASYFIPFLNETLPSPLHLLLGQIFDEYAFLDVEVHREHGLEHLQIPP